jgi:phospholipid/cholesterol/gamma-HCH transport system ATP-binding protein
MIELQNVSFKYELRPILDRISFRVEDGESAVILGPSGSGKSTILRLILGLEDPWEGEVLVDNNRISSMKEKQRRKMRKNIGMVFQEGALFDSLTVGENVGYYLAEHTKMSWTEIERKVRDMLGFVGLIAGEVIDQLPEELSGGMRRRVAIGRALLSTDPKVMLYDEPTTGLDPKATQNVIDLIDKLRRERSVSSIIVTHQIADMFGLADRYLIVLGGRVVFDGTLTELRDSMNEQVLVFLAPFRVTVADVIKRQFVTGLEL